MEIWSLSLWDEYGLRVLENKVPREEVMTYTTGTGSKETRLPSSPAGVKNPWSYTFTPPYVFIL